MTEGTGFAKLKKLKKADQEKAAKRAELEAAVAAATERRKRKPTPVPIAEPSKILFYDLETTGLNAGSDEIIQLAIVDGNGTELMLATKKSTLTALRYAISPR